MIEQQQSVDSWLEEEQQAEELPPSEEDKSPSFLEGICTKCLNSGFVHDVRNGVLGILYTVAQDDSHSKKLMICTHNQPSSI